VLDVHLPDRAQHEQTRLGQVEDRPRERRLIAVEAALMQSHLPVREELACRTIVPKEKQAPTEMREHDARNTGAQFERFVDRHRVTLKQDVEPFEQCPGR